MAPAKAGVMRHQFGVGSKVSKREKRMRMWGEVDEFTEENEPKEEINMALVIAVVAFLAAFAALMYEIVHTLAGEH